MNILHLSCCVAFLLTAVSTLNRETEKVKLASRIKCTENEFGKCLLEIAENLKSETVNLNRVRSKRSILKNGKCASGETWFLYKCVPCNVYEEYTGDIGKGC